MVVNDSSTELLVYFRSLCALIRRPATRAVGEQEETVHEGSTAGETKGRPGAGKGFPPHGKGPGPHDRRGALRQNGRRQHGERPSESHAPTQKNTRFLLSLKLVVTLSAEAAVAPWWRGGRLHPGSSQRRAGFRESSTGLHTALQHPETARRGKPLRESTLQLRFPASVFFTGCKDEHWGLLGFLFNSFRNAWLTLSSLLTSGTSLKQQSELRLFSTVLWGWSLHLCIFSAHYCH